MATVNLSSGFLPTPSSSLDILNRINEHFNTSHILPSQNPSFPLSKLSSLGSARSGVLRHIPKSLLLEKAAGDATQVWEEATKESPEYSSASGLSQRWKEFHGSNNWEGLLEPNLHPFLRWVILRYGEFAQATYDGFDFDPHSKYCGSCKHGRQRFLEKVGLSHAGYTVSKYLYAMSDVHLPSWFLRSDADASERWSNDSNWMGYVAVATDEKEISRLGRRDIVIAWRGTVTFLEWLQDLDQNSIHPCEAGTDLDVYVERGFWSLFTSKSDKTRYNKQSACEQVMEEVKRLLEEFKDEQVSITITGHSLGGALALLSAYKISQFCADKFSSDRASLPWISVFTFGGPRVGNEGFKRRLEELGVKTLRIVNANDAVPKVPGLVLNEGLWQPAKQGLGWVLEKMIMKRRYVHAGVQLVVNNLDSPFLKTDGSLPDFHNLEAYLHLVDGYQGVKRDDFRSETGRDIALINKSSGFLKKEMLVPPCWYQMENKGLVRKEDGKWVQPPREEDDLPHLHKSN